MARPREFNQEKVLSQIINIFWEKGFEGASMADIVEVTGLKKGSLYKCFGNKEKIFEMALEGYAKQGLLNSCQQDSPLDTLCRFYELLISEADLSKKKRRGCLIFNSCLEFGSKSNALSPYVLELAEKREKAFLDLIQEAQKNGEILPEIDAKKAAQRVFAATFTIREMVKFKPDKVFLSEIANSVLISLGTDKRVKARTTK